MAKRAEVNLAQTTGVLQFSGGGTNYLVKTPTGVLYCVYVDTGSDVAFRKSSDNGLTWSAPTIVFAGTVVALSIWYDRWSNISAGLIHCAYTESGGSDTLYRSIDSENSDTMGTQTTIFAGGSTAAGGMLSITRARGGNVYCRTCIDAGAEGGFYRLPNANVPSGAWDAARTVNEALATQDQMILVPGWAADDQDIFAFFWDNSANEISRQTYDDSANTWSETSIATSMTKTNASASFPHFAAAVDIANSQNLLLAWSGIDTANADLRCWKITESAITEVTNVVLNSTDDQGLAAIAIDTVSGYWYAFYAGLSAGSQTWSSSVKIYFKVSKDGGSTWGPESELTSALRPTAWICCTPRFDNNFALALHNDQTLDYIMISAPLICPRSSCMVGI